MGAQEIACEQSSGQSCATGRGWVRGKNGPMWAEFSWVEERRVLEGDIVVDPVVSAAADGVGIDSAIAAGPIDTWPGGVMPYTIDPGLGNVARVHDAIAHWNTKTGVSLVARTTQTDYITFQPGTGCSSWVGMRGGQQAIRLADGCDTGSAIHEIGHAFGLWHEQSRHDRDTYIEVRFENIEAGREHNFEKYVDGSGADAGAYDLASIMHYPTWAFSGNGQDTIVPRATLPLGVTLGQRDGLSAGDVDGITVLYGLAPVPLIGSGEVQPGLSGARGQELHFRVDVPEDVARLEIQIDGGSGDADLYVRFGERATRASFDCRPYIGGNAELCSFDAPTAGSWFVMLRGYASFGNVTLVAEQTATGGDDGLLESGVPQSGLAGARHEELHFRLDLPEGASELEILIRSGRGDADLYLRHGDAPTRTRFGCRPYVAGNDEVCRIDAPTAGSWYVMLRGWSSFSGVTLVASHDALGGIDSQLESGIARAGLGGGAGEELHFEIVVPEGVSLLQVVAGGGSGDADLYVRHGEAPTESSWDCRPYAAGNNEACAIGAPAAGTWHVMLRGWSDFSDLTLLAELLGQSG